MEGYTAMIYADTSNVKELYKPVMEMFLHGDTDYLAVLRKQFATAKVASIEEDGYGIFINFEVDPALRMLNPELQENMISGLVGIDESGEAICGFALFVSEGVIAQIDGYPFGPDTWPEERVVLKNVNKDIIFREEYCSDAWNFAKLSRLTYGKPIVLSGDELGNELISVDALDIEEVADSVMRKLTSGKDEGLHTLRNQFEHAEMEQCEFLGDIYRIAYRINPSTFAPCSDICPSILAGVVGVDANGKIVVWFSLVIHENETMRLTGESLLMNAWPEGEITLWFLNRDENGCEYLTAERQDAPNYPLKDDC